MSVGNSPVIEMQYGTTGMKTYRNENRPEAQWAKIVEISKRSDFKGTVRRPEFFTFEPERKVFTNPMIFMWWDMNDVYHAVRISSSGEILEEVTV